MKRTRIVALSIAALALAGCASNDHAKATAAPGMVNSKCPISGEACDTKVGADYHGKQVGFCCAKCKGKFGAMSDADKDACLAKVAK